MTPIAEIDGRIGWLLRFLVFAAKRFAADRGLQVAAALAYTSLLSLVPLMAVTLAMLTAFPVFADMGQQLQDFVFSNFVPTSGEVVRTHIAEFASKASRMSIVGAAVLLITALMLMNTIDKALNTIWRSHGRRRGASRFLVYWAVLTMGPVLIGMGLVATSYVASLAFLTETQGVAEVRTLGLRLMPFLTTALAFTLLYLVVPARPVPFRPAVIGGVVASLLFEAAKRGFAWYVTHFPTYEAIYGALATIPIFLIWIYLSWVIILLGAVLAHALMIYRDDDATTRRGQTARRFILAARVVGHLWQAQRKGRSLSERRLARLEHQFGEDVLGDVLGELEKIRAVHRTERGAWSLSRDPSDLTLLELYRAVPGPLSSHSHVSEDAADWERQLEQALGRAGASLEETLSITLRQLLDLPPQETPALTTQTAATLSASVETLREKSAPAEQ